MWQQTSSVMEVLRGNRNQASSIVYSQMALRQVSMRKRGVVDMFDTLVRGLLWTSKDFTEFFRQFIQWVSIRAEVEKDQVLSLNRMVFAKKASDRQYLWYIGDEDADIPGAIPILVAWIKSQLHRVRFQPCSKNMDCAAQMVLLPGNVNTDKVSVHKTLVTVEFDFSAHSATDFILKLTRLEEVNDEPSSLPAPRRCAIQ